MCEYVDAGVSMLCLSLLWSSLHCMLSLIAGERRERAERMEMTVCGKVEMGRVVVGG